LKEEVMGYPTIDTAYTTVQTTKINDQRIELHSNDTGLNINPTTPEALQESANNQSCFTLNNMGKKIFTVSSMISIGAVISPLLFPIPTNIALPMIINGIIVGMGSIYGACTISS
jgi:hypothetical protein